MDDSLSALPKAVVLVYASVLGASVSANARASSLDSPASTDALLEVTQAAQPQTAPTCGPSCHTPGYQLTPVDEPPQDEQAKQPPQDEQPIDDLPIAPTCGPACHGGGGYAGGGPQDAVPPPLPPEPSKKGCSTTDIDPASGLALLGLGLGLGLSGLSRRRSRSSEP